MKNESLELRDMAAQILTKGSKAKALFQFAANAIDERDELQDKVYSLQGVIGAVCLVCQWSNTGCLNIGDEGNPKWMCHGCIKSDLDTSHRILKSCLAYLRTGNKRELYFEACQVLGIEPEVWENQFVRAGYPVVCPDCCGRGCQRCNYDGEVAPESISKPTQDPATANETKP